MKQHLVLLQDNSNIDKTISALLLTYKGELMQHLHCNETTFYSAYKRVHLLTDFPKLNAQVRNSINAQNHTTPFQLAQQPVTQEEMVEVSNDDDTLDNTPPSQSHDFTALAFGTNTPTPVVPPPPPQPQPATTDLNDHPRLKNNYVNNRTT
eukprot:10273300-Ditylum_brightwellii.AAC.1